MHPQLIRHYSNLRKYYRTRLYYRFWPYYQISQVSLEHCNGCGQPTEDAYSSGHLVMSHLGLAFVLMLRPFFPELIMSTDLLSFEHPSVLLFCLIIIKTRGPKGHISCTWVQCATFLKNWPGQPFCCSDWPEKYKLGRGCYDLASCQISLNSIQPFQKRSRKCLSLSEARVAIFFVFSDQPETQTW